MNGGALRTPRSPTTYALLHANTNVTGTPAVSAIDLSPGRLGDLERNQAIRSRKPQSRAFVLSLFLMVLLKVSSA
ncbi:hypothetical protein GCM10017788_41860 [Amycolatopsis acidiphila]|nr:hypothetical protein GCM10017788_41860 [Amycolatopsis acidiphila]